MTPMTDDLIKLYFSIGFSNKEILMLLAQNHRIVLSIRTLKRHCRELGLFRRKHHSDLNDVKAFLQQELQHDGQMQGYRWLHLRAVQNGLVVQQDTIRQIIKFLDPEGVELRRTRRLRRRQYNTKGPNALWHMDSYDKLKPYGIGINGCIDGFSRFVLWMEAYTTNNDPKVVANYFIECVTRLGGCPERIRADNGTENGNVANMQVFLRRNHTDSFAKDSSFIYGRSTANQRIESWWGILRKQSIQFWMNIFKTLQENGHFSGSFLDKSLVQFCFLNLVQRDVNEVVRTWNTHYIRPRPGQEVAGGRPILMYTVPQEYDAEDCLKTVDMEEVAVCKEECTPKSQFPCDETVFELCLLLMQENEWEAPTDAYNAAELYTSLRAVLLQNL
ncbi:uncharacterized protein LOC118562959 [Fundulus heteroclitus]|uniref:uncharacterized protein LOC118562353 n=1 Tax=Fundulus heteroclitus TaxID=8078 RepID=UPI00165CD8B2|nr:uncharacterized protein LOC118562353 [Fundulus heteroclitus]XP_035992202.1 uncharacterized protein LOC118562959 [Fundulus heteroclitus]